MKKRHLWIFLLLSLCACCLFSCGDKNEVTSTTAGVCQHSFGEWQTKIQSTCIVQGTRERTCTLCGAKETVSDLPLVGHSYSVWETVVQSTCTVKGTRERTCTVCGLKDTRNDLPLSKHTYDTVGIHTDGSCVEYGFTSYTCTVCGDIKKIDDTVYGAHSFVSGVCTVCGFDGCTHSMSRNAPTCTQSATCSYCGGTIEALGHYYVLPGLHTEGDCAHYGFSTETCIRCNQTCTVPDTVYGNHRYVDGVCDICSAESGKLTIRETDADIVILPDKYNTGAGSIAYPNEEIIKVDIAGVYNGFTVSGKSGSSWRVSVKGLDPQNNEIVIRNLDFSSASFLGVTDTGTLTQNITVKFVNCIFKEISTARDGMSNKVYLSFDHCTIKKFSGSNVIFDWCYFGGNDYMDGMNPFQNVTVKNTYVGEKDSFKLDSEMHTDATQIYAYGPGNASWAPGPNTTPIIACNQYYYNFRGEMPAVYYSGSMAYTNSILMISLDYYDADNITFEHCTINGGGCPIMIFDSPKASSWGEQWSFKMTNILYTDIKYGCSQKYNVSVIGITSESQLDYRKDTIVSADSLYVGSVWARDGKTHFSVTNDTNEVREFTVLTETKKYSFIIDACPVYIEFEKDQAFSEFPFDIDCVIDGEANWAVCYDSTNGDFKQIRFYNPNGETVQLDASRLENWVSCETLYEIAHGRMGNTGDNLYWRLTSDGTLTIEKSDNITGARSTALKPDTTQNTPLHDFYPYKDLVKSVVFKPGVTRINNSMFSGFKMLESVKIPSSVRTIGASAFSSCERLTTANIPYGVTSIGADAFSSCRSLTSIVIPSTVTVLGDNVIKECENLKEAVFAARISSIPSDFFNGCRKLKKVTLTASVHLIGANAFAFCHELDSVSFVGDETEFTDISVLGTLNTFLNASVTYLTDTELAALEDRTLATREPKVTTVITPKLNKTYDGNPISYVPQTNSDGKVTLTWMKDTVIIDGPPKDAGRYIVKVRIEETENYQSFFETYVFYINQGKAFLFLSSESLDKVYDGKPVEAPSYTAEEGATVSVVWKNGDAVCETEPYLPGVYTLVVTVAGNTNYISASATKTVTIAPPDGITCWNGTSAEAFAGGTGTETDPYLIATAEQLARLASLVNGAETHDVYAGAAYRLTGDVFLNDGASSYMGWTSVKPAQAWTAIGQDAATSFSGTFDGNGFTIFGLYCAAGTKYGNGLFGHLDLATVNNLHISDSTIVNAGSSATFTGMLAAYAKDSLLSGITVSNAVLLAAYNCGGIVGYFTPSTTDCIIENCHVNAQLYSVKSSQNTFGGIAGKVSGGSVSLRAIVRDCTVRGSISSTNTVCGIVAGISVNTALTLDGCINYASVSASGSGYVAGLIGRSSSTTGNRQIIIRNCINFGDITATSSYAGGLIATSNMKNSSLTIENCANYGTVTAGATYAGGIIGHLSGTGQLTLNNVLSVGEVNAANIFGTVVGGFGDTVPPLSVEGCYFAEGSYPVSTGALDGATSVSDFTSAKLLADMNEWATENALYLWTEGQNGPKFLSLLSMISTDLDRYCDGTPVQNPVYAVGRGDGKISILWYQNGTALAGAPTEAGDYIVVITLSETEGFSEATVRLDVTLTAQGAPKLRINSLDKVYDGVAVENPVISTTNTGASVSFTYYSGVYGSGTVLAGAPIDAGIYYVVVSVEAQGDFAAITKYKAFEISVCEGTISGFTSPEREYNGEPVTVTGYSYNGTSTVTIEYYKGTYLLREEKLSEAPTEIGSYTVILKAEAEKNFSGAEVYCDFRIFPIASSINITSLVGKPFDGNAVAIPTYTKTESGGAVSVLWMDKYGNELESAPSAVGSYRVTLSLAACGNYDSSEATQFFDIWQVGAVWTGDRAVSFAGGTGTAENPFLIATPEQLSYLSYVVNSGAKYTVENGMVLSGGLLSYGEACYLLTADLKLNANSENYAMWVVYDKATDTWSVEAPQNVFNAIGNSSSYFFAGTFDGNGHTVSGLFVDTNGALEAGLFGLIKGGTVKNLTVSESSVSCRVTGNAFAGTIVAKMPKGTILNCTADKVVVNAYTYAGGIIGFACEQAYDRVEVTDTSFNGTVNVIKQNAYAGGIIGRVTVYSAVAVLTGCTVSGSVYSYGFAAGLANCYGSNPELSVTDCANHASVIAETENAGGIASRITSTSSTSYVKVKNFVNTGTINAAKYAGGLFGEKQAAACPLALENVLNTGTVKTTGTDASVCGAGGLIGFIQTDTTLEMTNCVATGSVSGTNAGAVFGLVKEGVDKNGNALFRFTATGLYATENAVGADVGENKVTALVTILNASQMAGTEKINETQYLTDALNDAITQENGYSTWAYDNGVLILTTPAEV